MEEFGHRSAETKRCVVNLACLCVVENLPLHMGTRAGFVKFMRQWEPRWTSISKQSLTRSVEEQSQALRADIKPEMLETEAGHSLHDGFLDEPNIGELYDDEYALDNMGLGPENAYLGDNAFPQNTYHHKHF